MRIVTTLATISTLLVVQSIVRAQPTTAPATAPVTPVTLPGATTYVYRDLQPEPVRLHVFKPDGWKPTDRRPAMISFFGGGWLRGTPANSAGTARLAARWGMVGIAPDYRVRQRFPDASPIDAVADGRFAVRWVQDHADQLGIDPARIVVGGNSAGAHLALWCAIEKAPVGSSPDESPRHKPIALVLTSCASDTSAANFAARFNGRERDLSAVANLDAQMPPILAFHGDADTVVPYRYAVALRDRLIASGNVCELITVPGGGHNFRTDLPEWRDKTERMVRAFLAKQRVLP